MTVGGLAIDAMFPFARPALGFGLSRGLGGYEQAYSRFAHGLYDANQWGGTAALQLGRWLNWQVCFAPGTPLRVPGGSRNIEDIRVGDLVLSRDENNCEGPVEAKMVEEVFRREGLLAKLRVNGREILTTDEHPFFVAGRGWAPCNQMKVGDRLLSESGAWVTVEAVESTGEWATVYNLRVADYHTYFVGDESWGFSVWAHNNNCHGSFQELHDAGGDAIARGDPTNVTAGRRRAGGNAAGDPDNPAEVGVAGPRATADIAADLRRIVNNGRRVEQDGTLELRAILFNGEITPAPNALVMIGHASNGVGGSVVQTGPNGGKRPTYPQEFRALRALGLLPADIAACLLEHAQSQRALWDSVLNPQQPGRFHAQCAVALLTHLFTTEGARSNLFASNIVMFLDLALNGRINFQRAFRVCPIS
jgi:hypothetical protein